MTTAVRNAMPPPAALAVLNPVNRVLLRTPLGRLMSSFALLEFRGRRTGRTYRVPVGWHTAAGAAPIVVTPAPWRQNFGTGTPARVWYRGRVAEMVGTRVTDPVQVTDAINSLFAAGTKPTLVGMRTPDGHRLTVEDVVELDRNLLVFAVADPTPAT